MCLRVPSKCLCRISTVDPRADVAASIFFFKSSGALAVALAATFLASSSP